MTSLGGGKHEISDADAVRPEERRALELRRVFVAQALAPCAADEAARCVSRLFGLIPESGDAEATKKTISDYARALASQPIWAVQAACRKALDSRREFRPAAPLLLAYARDETKPARAEIDEIEALLNARVFRSPGPDERARVAAMFAQLGRNLSVEAETRGAERSAPRSIDEFVEWSKRTPMQASPALLKSLGIRVTDAHATGREA